MIKKAVWVVPVVLCGVLLGGCKKDSVSSLKEKAQAVTQISKSKTKLDELFTYDMLESNVSELEKVTGKPRKKSGRTREYKVDGCPVTVETSRDRIHSLEVEVSASCTFDLKQVASSLPEGTQVNQLTHGAFASAAGIGGEFMADCLGGCGNAFDPSVYQHWVGSRADQMVNIMLRTKLVDDKAIDAAQKWQEMMEKEEGEGFVMNAEFNCGKYNSEAQQFFKDVPITHVRVGLDLEKDARDIKGPALQCQPGGKATQAEHAEHRKQAQQRKQPVQQKKQGQQHQQQSSTKSENKILNIMQSVKRGLKSVKREKYVEVNPTD